MPALTKNFLDQLQENPYEYKCFIETGTHIAETILAMEPHFDELYTIELAEFFYQISKRQYQGNKIQFILGDSAKELKSLLPQINQPTIFFLDGHFSGDIRGKGEKDCPLLEELEQINTHFQHKAIIIIDDARIFGKTQDGSLDLDWSQINEQSLLDKINSRLTKHYYLDSSHAPNDRFILHIDPLSPQEII